MKILRTIVKALDAFRARALLAAAAVIGYTSYLVETISAPRFRYELECIGPDGKVKWRETFTNLVTNAGRTDLVTNYFKGSAYTAAFYVGLIDSTGYTTGAANTDTMSSHGGWTTESVPYSNGTRPALTLGSVTGTTTVSVDNSASKASYTINASATVKGAFVTTNNTKSGTSGTLYSAGTFTGGDRTVANGDTLNVQVTLSVS
jgi:hypothetical protein